MATVIESLRTIEISDEQSLLDMIDRWVDREVAPVVKQFDHADEWPEHLVGQMAEFGLFGATVSEEYGGLELGRINVHPGASGLPKGPCAWGSNMQRCARHSGSPFANIKQSSSSSEKWPRGRVQPGF